MRSLRYFAKHQRFQNFNQRKDFVPLRCFFAPQRKFFTKNQVFKPYTNEKSGLGEVALTLYYKYTTIFLEIQMLNILTF